MAPELIHVSYESAFDSFIIYACDEFAESSERSGARGRGYKLRSKKGFLQRVVMHVMDMPVCEAEHLRTHGRGTDPHFGFGKALYTHRG